MNKNTNVNWRDAAENLDGRLKVKKLGNIHRSDRRKQDVRLLSVLGRKLLDDGSKTLEGHVAGRKGMQVRYRVSWPRVGSQPQIDILSHSGVTKQDALSLVETELVNLYIKSTRPKPEKFNSKYLKGFYLWSEIPGRGGLRNLRTAVDQGIIPPEFAETCVDLKVSMRRYKC